MATNFDAPIEIPQKKARLSGQKADLKMSDEVCNEQKVSSPQIGEEEIAEHSIKPHNDETKCKQVDTTQSSDDIADHEDADDGGDDEDENSDSISEISNLSALDDEMRESKWRQNQGPLAWVQLKMISGADPRAVLKELLPSNMTIPAGVDDVTLWRLVISILSEPPRRKKLKHVGTLGDVVQLIRTCKRIMVLTGAGISVSCGIPDFRSRNGIYARLAVEYPDLSEPQDMFDIHYFTKNPRPFFKFASEIYPGQFAPSISHRFIKRLEENRKLLRNYTQNIDTLEQCAGIENVIQCHGSFATASCMVCKYQVKSDAIKNDILKQAIPRCPRCSPCHTSAVMKPDIVFFGEGLPDEFHKQMEIDKDQCDLLIVIGSSLKVRPVALIPNSLPAKVPQILINREPLRHMNFDVELLGDCDVIIDVLTYLLGDGWKDLSSNDVLTEVSHDVICDVAGRDDVVSADDDTCDSVTETVRCNFCISSNESHECNHDDASKGDGDVDKKCDVAAPIDVAPSTPTSANTAAMTSHGDNASEILLNNMPQSSTESVSSDYTLQEASEPTVTGPPEWKDSLAKRLPAGTYAFLPPNRYLFPGGELAKYNPQDASSSDDSTSSDDSDAEHSGDAEVKNDKREENSSARNVTS